MRDRTDNNNVKQATAQNRNEKHEREKQSTPLTVCSLPLSSSTLHDRDIVNEHNKATAKSRKKKDKRKNKSSPPILSSNPFAVLSSLSSPPRSPRSANQKQANASDRKEATTESPALFSSSHSLDSSDSSDLLYLSDYSDSGFSRSSSASFSLHERTTKQKATAKGKETGRKKEQATEN
jgi:hypothetical protein